MALVGATGGGKSTVLRLRMRFLEADRGRILLDGMDITTYDPRSLRALIGYVAQDSFLTDGTVAENIGYGEAVPDVAAVEAAARAAEVHDFIESLPHGYLSLVGERGTRLSGGQRQRIALEQGRIVESGTHEHLVARGGLYAFLWRLQTGEVTGHG